MLGPQPSTQIALDLSLRPNYSQSRFVDAPSNAEARSALQPESVWANGSLALIGPKGSGKTHLGHLWQARTGAVSVAPDSGLDAIGDWRGKRLWIDTSGSAHEPLLFAVMNMAMRGEISQLLLTARRPPSLWNVDIPDLRSRLGAMQVVRLGPPEDALLESIYRKLFLDRGLKVQDSLISYLLLRQNRSVDAAYAVVDRLDKLAATQKVNVTRNFAAKWLDDQGELF